MKVREVMLGVGLGMILASSVSLVSTSENKNMSDDEIKKKALELGMVEKEDAMSVLEKKEQEAASPIAESSSPKATVEKVVETLNPTESVTKQPEATKKPAESTKQPATKVSATEKPKKNNTSYVTLSIRSGMVSRQIASTLQSLDVVDDAEAFDKYICDNGYGSSIRVGVYRIPVGATYQQIAEIITN
ncbi:MAG: hypothetical protein K5895_04400 [Lachnospiraceae bacterium]|nr:hypothetical protein [Lachnospiraceae bacterium]